MSQNNMGRPYVALEYCIWPSIYKPDPTYAFPTLEAAHKFAQGALSKAVIAARVYSSDSVLLQTYEEKND